MTDLTQAMIKLGDKVLRDIAAGKATRNVTAYGGRPDAKAFYSLHGQVFVMLPDLDDSEDQPLYAQVLIAVAAHYSDTGYTAEKFADIGVMIRLDTRSTRV